MPNNTYRGREWLSDLQPGERIEAIERTIADLIDLRHAALREMPYADYLLSDHWRDERRFALEQAGARCQVCNKAKSHDDEAGYELHVHHRTYARRGEEQPGDLIVLCEGCHDLFHANRELAA